MGDTKDDNVSSTWGGRVSCGRCCQAASPRRGSVPGLVEFVILDWTKRCQERARKGQREPSGASWAPLSSMDFTLGRRV